MGFRTSGVVSMHIPEKCMSLLIIDAPVAEAGLKAVPAILYKTQQIHYISLLEYTLGTKNIVNSFL